MTSKEIQCTYCGLKGEIGILNHKYHISDSKVFRHVGHNPFSGHLHYQCPSCSIVLLVEPMDVLGGKLLQGVPSRLEKKNSFSTILSSYFYQLADFVKSFKPPRLAGGLHGD